MNARTLQEGGLETVLANQELMVANSHAEQLKCCSISALMVAFRGPSFSGVLKGSQGYSARPSRVTGTWRGSGGTRDR
jgi:hypothetical protein